MNQRDLEHLLDAHADGLRVGQDLAGDLLARRPWAAQAARPLMALASRVQATLRPVEPRAAFVEQLKARLAARPASPAAQPKPLRHSIWWLVLAGVGGVVSLASVVVLIFRLITGVMRLVGDFLEWRASRMPQAKIRSTA